MELTFNYSMHPYDDADWKGASIITTFGITHNGMLDHMLIACQEPQWHITCQNEMCHCKLTIKKCISHIKIVVGINKLQHESHVTTN